MRKIIQVLAVVAAISTGSFAFGQSTSQAKVIAYYFHGSFRCVTCTNMEKYSQEAIESNFKDALTLGGLEFKAVNVEERGNEHFVNDYQLYTKALVLSMVKDGKEVGSKNLDKIWEFARNKQKFMDYVTGEIKEFMRDNQ
ncbi:MAG TPA: nitrophenyl compound nitroreductase subunit ArsF family protein [Candidatus Omnitrophota bacterium]|nr:nitrophenyl compound nitroreductase subunit ArsF family protein [Candidatus Omnitrophota bacterium]